MDRRLGFVKKDFIEIFHSDLNEDKLKFQQYFLLGNYTEQIKRYIHFFGTENIKIILSDDLKANTESVVTDLYDFLEIENFSFQKTINHNSYKEAKSGLVKYIYASSFFRDSVKKLIPKAALNKIRNTFFNMNPPKLEDSERIILEKYYEKEIISLGGLLLKDLSEWM